MKTFVVAVPVADACARTGLCDDADTFTAWYGHTVDTTTGTADLGAFVGTEVPEWPRMAVAPDADASDAPGGGRH